MAFACCNREQAWAWVDVLAEDALSGGRLSKRLLPRAVHHALLIEAQL
jgi:hypothetical protein